LAPGEYNEETKEYKKTSVLQKKRCKYSEAKTAEVERSKLHKNAGMPRRNHNFFFCICPSLAPSLCSTTFDASSLLPSLDTKKGTFYRFGTLPFLFSNPRAHICATPPLPSRQGRGLARQPTSKLLCIWTYFLRAL
jgi:hypothetical protein